MRGICLVLALLGVPAIAAAQRTFHASAGAASAQGSTGSSGSAGSAGSTGSLGSIGLPLPSIGLPLPSIGLSPRAPMDDAWQRGSYGGRQRGGERRDGEWRDGGQWREGSQYRGPSDSFRHQRGGYVYLAPPYPYASPYPYYGPVYGMPSTQVITQATAVPGVITVVEPQTGRLVLEVEPADILQVFVDGEYVGTPADLGSALDLKPGTRRIEFRAPGYKTLTIDAQIASQRTIVYRATLERLVPARVVPPPAATAPPAPEPTPVPAANRVMYLIPGCYMGNVPPQDLKLPAGCDLSRLTTITP